MPYIKQEEREAFNPYCVPADAGQLNYAITKMCHEYLNWPVPPTYADYNEVVGVLECAKLEFYRRMVAPYEDVKLKQNGDIE